MAWIFPSSSNRPLLFKARASTGEISRDRFRENSLAQRQSPLDMLSRTKGSFFQSVALTLCFCCLYERLTISLVEMFSNICFLEDNPSQHCQQTQWLDPFNRDRRCDPQFRKEDILKRWVNFTFCVQCKSREFIQQLKKHYWAFFWRVSVYRGVRKKQFRKTYGPFLC